MNNGQTTSPPIQNSLTTPTSPTRPKSPKSPKSLTSPKSFTSFTRPTRPTNSKFKIQNSKFFSAKDERRMSEGLAKDKSLPARKTQFIIHNSKLFHIVAEFNH